MREIGFIAVGFTALVVSACTPVVPPEAGVSREDSEAHLFALCQDGRDNDLDGLTDCADDDCGAFLVCGGATSSDVLSSEPDASEENPDAGGSAQPCASDDECDPLRGLTCIGGGCRVPPDFTVPPPPEAYPSMGMLVAPALAPEPAATRDVIGAFCGIEAREHGPLREAFDSRSAYGYGYQSTELAYRFLCDFAARLSAPEHDSIAFGCSLGDSGAERLRGDAWYDATTDATLGLLDRIDNGGPVPPRPGDIVVWDVAPNGHVAIVKRVLLNDRYGMVEVLEQGLREGSHRYRIDVADNGTYAIPGARGWLRVPGSPSGCGVSGAFDLVEVADVDGRKLLVVDAHVDGEPPAYIARIALVDEDQVVRLTRSFPAGAKSAALSVSLDLDGQGTTVGAHTLALNVTLDGAAPTVTETVATAGFVVADPQVAAPFRADFEAAAAEHGVPSCLLQAIAAAASSFRQGERSPRGVGIMQLGPADLELAAQLTGLTPTLLGEDSDAGRAANINGAAALLASWARDGGLAAGPESAVESWWMAVARLGGAGVDGDLLTSGFVYRVYAALAQGVPGRLARLPGLDIATLAPVVETRPATPLELALGDVLPGDAALEPTTAPLYVRRFGPPSVAALTSLHRCDGVCTSESCASVACTAEATLDCVAGDVVWRDACGGLGATAVECPAPTEPCAVEACVAARCVQATAPDGTACPDGTVCSEGLCRMPNDVDGDGHFVDQAPFDCPGHDDDEYIHPDHPEVLDVRDNDCDGVADDVGYVRLERYRKVWASNDWEHRYAAPPLALPGWEHEDRWIGIYPPNLCDPDVPSGPLDGCSYQKNGAEIMLGEGFVLVGLVQCTGVYPATGKHISLLLQEDSGEYVDYVQNPYFTCTRLGYLPGSAAQAEMPSLKYTYRHRASFVDGVSDNMWSILPLEDEPRYDVHTLSFAVLDGG